MTGWATEERTAEEQKARIGRTGKARAGAARARPNLQGMKLSSARALLVCLVAAVVVPGVATAGQECRAISDPIGDHAGVAGIQMPTAEQRAGDAADLTGFAIYPAGWGDLIVHLGVADIEAPLHPLADADRYAVVWTFDGRRFTVEALRSELGWSYTAWARHLDPALDPGELEDQTYPIVGTVDPQTDSLTMVLSALALEGPAGPRTLHEVSASAEEIRRIGIESATLGAHALAAPFADHAPDTATGWTTIDLDVACGPTTWVGATPMCRVADDATGDVSAAATLITGGGDSSIDLTGVFVASSSSDLILEIGVARVAGAAPGTGAIYGARFDVDGRTLLLEASRSGIDWRYEAHMAGDEPGSLPVGGSVSADRIRFEVPADLIAAAFTGRPMRAFSAWSRVLLEPGVAIDADEAPDGGPDHVGHTLGGPCAGF